MNWKKKLAIAAALIGCATISIHIINKVITFLSTSDQHLKKDSGNYYDWRFGKVFYNEQGEGKPILLIHSIETTSSNHEWYKIVDKLSKTNKVYSIDLLGCGRSDKPNITYTNFLYVQLVTDFIKNQIKEKTDIITSGNSISIATMSALYNNDLIDRIIVSNPSDLNYISTVPSKRTKTLKFLIKMPIIGTLLYNILNNRHAIEEAFINEYFSNPSNIKNSDISIYHESAHLGGASSKYLYASLKGRYININILPSLKTISNSIYIITGTETPNYLTSAEQYKKYMPSVEIISLEDTNGLPHMESPKHFVDQVNVFFDL